MIIVSFHNKQQKNKSIEYPAVATVVFNLKIVLSFFGTVQRSMQSLSANVLFWELVAKKPLCKRRIFKILFCPSCPGYALDPSIDNYEVPTKYIGSVEEAEKNQGK